MSESRASASVPSDDTSTAALLAVVRGRPLHPLVFVMVLGALTALGPFTMDLYLPAFPMVAADLHASAGLVQVTLTATAVGLGIGQLIVGPLSDAAGRRIPLVWATALHVLCSAVIVVAPTVDLVAVARFGQGAGAAAGAVVASAMVRDVFGGLRLVRIGARVALVNGAAPIIAPVLGSQLLLITTWRGVFAVLALFGLTVLLAAAILLPETRPRTGRNPSTAATARTRIAILLRDRIYVGTVLVSTMVFVDRDPARSAADAPVPAGDAPVCSSPGSHVERPGLHRSRTGRRRMGVGAGRRVRARRDARIHRSVRERPDPGRSPQ
jgi:MFS family permease